MGFYGKRNAVKLKLTFIISSVVLIPLILVGQNRTQKMDFQGKYLVAISDADMLSSVYVDGRLGPREGKDALSVIPPVVAGPSERITREAHTMVVAR